LHRDTNHECILETTHVPTSSVAAVMAATIDSKQFEKLQCFVAWNCDS